jgi:hypothetical protein
MNTAIHPDLPALFTKEVRRVFDLRAGFHSPSNFLALTLFVLKLVADVCDCLSR